jgi:hypothetical protein
MLQWNPRLVTLLILVLLIAAFVADIHGIGGGRGWKWD